MYRNESLSGMKILYAEDDKEAREELLDVLRRRAGKVMTAGDGQEGLELFETFMPDILLVDLYMPKISGLDMISEIRARNHRTPVIVISAVDEVSTILSAVDLGISKYIIKPINVQELLEAIEEIALELIKSRKQNRAAVTDEDKKAMEDEIKKSFAHFLKVNTGKGPRDVNVFVGSDTVEIVASEVLTVLEKNIIDNFQNIAIIKYVRRQFFSVKEKELIQMISGITFKEASLREVQVFAEKDKIKLIFGI